MFIDDFFQFTTAVVELYWQYNWLYGVVLLTVLEDGLFMFELQCLNGCLCLCGFVASLDKFLCEFFLSFRQMFVSVSLYVGIWLFHQWLLLFCRALGGRTFCDVQLFVSLLDMCFDV